MKQLEELLESIDHVSSEGKRKLLVLYPLFTFEYDDNGVQRTAQVGFQAEDTNTVVFSFHNKAYFMDIRNLTAEVLAKYKQETKQE